MSFLNQYFLLLLIIPFLLLFISIKKRDFSLFFSDEVLDKIRVKKNGFSRKTRSYLLIISIAFAIISLSRPILDNGKIELKTDGVDVIIGLDISKSMSIDDIFPNRFEFSKRKIFAFMQNAIDKEIALIGFSNQSFLISPLTSDFSSLRYLVSNLKFNYLNLKGTNIMSLLEATNSLFSNKKHKVLIVFSDGGDEENYSKEIKYAKEHNIIVFIYMSATDKGGLLKADNDDVVLLKANDGIKNLAFETGGAFMRYSLNNEDMKELNKITSLKFENENKKNKTIYNTKELFYYPLMLSILFFMMANFSLKTKGRL